MNESAPERYLSLLRNVIERQAALIAQWMNAGFIHGVMNTDNMTLSGETIDYGPCAFIEAYDPAAVFSSIDHQATRVLRDGEKRWRRDNDLFNALGVVQVMRDALDDAVHSFEQAIASAPNDAVAYFNLAKACELKYWKYRRFVSQTRQWIANGNDRNKAIENYNRYLDLGGPLENAAREGLTRLNWSPP